nr:TIGR03936 family radical SAM-associated protein [Polyangiaceae bacterium]
QIVDTVVSAIKKSGHDEVSLTSLSTADYSCIAPLVKKVVDKLNPALVSLGVSSLRAYGLGEDVMDDMQGIRASGLTFAPEAGSQRMRDVVNKNVTEEQLHQTAERVFARSWNAMKLYFMIGLPTEEEEDVREIVRVGGRTLDIGRRAKQARKQRAPTVTVSVSTHVPKPHTPFQWCAMDPPDLVEKKQAWLREEQQTAKVDLRLHDSKGSWLEGVFARGDRKLGAVLLDAYQRGARFDSWEDQLNLEAWNEAFRGASIDPAIYLGTLPTSAVLPWNHIDVGLEQGFLEREYRKALSSRLSPPCGKVAGAFVHATNLKEAESETKRLVCYDCGVACDLTAMREERLVYLRALGAEAPRQRSLEPVPARAAVEKGKAPAMIVQGEPVRYRFGFTKLGPAAFLSHLDLIRTLPRVFRRAEIPMFYSSGFHPKPEMVFGPALSLGVGSLREYMDIKLTTNEDARDLLVRVNAVSEPGLVFFGAEKLAKGDAALSKSISVARYGVAIARATLASHASAKGHESAWLQAMRNAFVEQAEHVLIRTIDGIGKKVNVREFVTSLSVCTARPPWADPLGLEGDLYFIEADVEIRGNGSAKISEVMTAAFGDIPYAASRIDLGALSDPLENGERSVRTPFEVIMKTPDSPARTVVESVSA